MKNSLMDCLASRCCLYDYWKIRKTLSHSVNLYITYARVRIPCLLQVEYELDDKYKIVPKSEKYVVKEVIGGIIEPPEQTSFFDETL